VINVLAVIRQALTANAERTQMAEHSGAKYIPEVLILCGLPASGKSTKARNWVKEEPSRRVRINYDDLRKELFTTPGWKWNRKDEDLMKAKARELFENALKLGMSVVVDNTSLTKKSRQEWIDLATTHGIKTEVEEVGGWLPIWELAARDCKRGADRVGRAVIERMALWHGYIDWKDKAHSKKEGIVICDLDGTLCDITHRRHFVDGTRLKCKQCKQEPGLIVTLPDGQGCGRCGGIIVPVKDWKNFFANVKDDALCGPVADLLDALQRDHLILLVSGRPIDQCGIATEDWLKRMDVPYDHLFMRASGDNREDTIIKKEILDLLPKERIDFCIDDRNSVVKMWRDQGLFCLQVAEGDF
jgi:predicted kinase